MADRITRVYFYHHTHTDIGYTHPQEEVEETEAAYIAFPFALRPEGVTCDISGGAFTPGLEQIRGTATDWYNLGHGVQLSDQEVTLTWLCAETPLVEFGEMKTGKTPSPPIIDNGHIFSYVLNNHWMTNFFSRQSGEITARFRLFSESSSPLGGLGQAGRELLNPLLAVRLGAHNAPDPEGAIDAIEASARSFAEVIAGEASLDAVTRAHDGAGWIVRLHEIGGRPGMAQLRLNWPTPVHAVPCYLREQPLAGASPTNPAREHILEVDLLPFGTASWRLQP